MLKRHAIEILLKVGHAEVEVGHLTGVSLRSINRIAEEAPIVHVDDAAEREKRRIGSHVADGRCPWPPRLQEPTATACMPRGTVPSGAHQLSDARNCSTCRKD